VEEWTSFIPLVIALLVAIGLPLAARSLRKSGRSKAEEFAQHLKEIGVSASLQPEETGRGQARGKRSWGQKAVGTIKVEDGNIDSIDVIGVASQYGVNYYLDYVVSRSTFASGVKKRKTTMTTKKSRQLKGKVIDIGWKGDDFLAQKLNFDYRLKDELLQADLSVLKGGISIHPEPKHNYARIRTAYVLPERQLLEALDIIAGHMKSWY